jgi:hypothetical protein
MITGPQGRDIIRAVLAIDSLIPVLSTQTISKMMTVFNVYLTIPMYDEFRPQPVWNGGAHRKNG